MYTLAKMLDALDQLTIDEEVTLLAILRERAAERGRAKILQDVHEVRREFSACLARSASAREMMDEARGDVN